MRPTALERQQRAPRGCDGARARAAAPWPLNNPAPHVARAAIAAARRAALFARGAAAAARDAAPQQQPLFQAPQAAAPQQLQAAAAAAPQQQQQQQQQPAAARQRVRVQALALKPLEPAFPEPPAAAGGCCACGALGWNTNFAARFDLGPEVGRGSFGVVHLATHRSSGERYAVKVLRKCPPGTAEAVAGAAAAAGGGSDSGSAVAGAAPGERGAASEGSLTGLSVTSDDGCRVDATPHAAALESIEREVSAWLSVQGSRYVARLLALYEDDSCAYLVQEYLEGGTLKRRLDAAGGKLGEAEAAAVMRGVLDVLCEAHRRDICYGDVKPANFLVIGGEGGDGSAVEVRAVDFGCSRPVPVTKPCGSPLFMAPEMITHGHRRFGTAVDVWAAGVMLYQLLTGVLPFWTNMTPKEVAALPPYSILAAVRTHDVSYPRALWSGISPEAKELVASMLDRNPAARITADEALAHAWLPRALGRAPRPTGLEAAREEARGSEVEFSDRIAALHL
ncbi:MAG: kinase-like domain-containing protein [Monoraphidium minutum]|nr:MAG: kinase-like domain-containing protein [Monoraphidium minutum]